MCKRLNTPFKWENKLNMVKYGICLHIFVHNCCEWGTKWNISIICAINFPQDTFIFYFLSNMLNSCIKMYFVEDVLTCPQTFAYDCIKGLQAITFMITSDKVRTRRIVSSYRTNVGNTWSPVRNNTENQSLLRMLKLSL